ncbi:MAG: hypothetical protein C4536_12930 [Actinobacteria bacterium]|jgi:hypothetical protein|nr:MAG: hypothetical protein C4536_12930 [Actinomycetota bacterium]
MVSNRVREGSPLTVIEAAGDYAYGLVLGRRYGDAYRKILRHTRPLRADSLRHREKTLAQFYPRALERLEGLARSAGLERNRLLSAGPGNPFPAPACTNFAAVPPATRDGRAFLNWNLDLPRWWRNFMGRFPFYVRRIKGCKSYLCIDHSFMGLPLTYGFGLMNSEGLSCVYNAVGMTDGGDGLTFFELNNMMMEEHADVAGAVSVMEANPRFVLPGQASAIMLNANLLVGDARGDAALIEYSHHHLEVTPASRFDGLLASTNHHQFIDRAETGSVDPAAEPLISGSYARLARAWDLLRSHHGGIDPAVAQAITSDHGCDYGPLREYGIERRWYEERIDDSTICAHPWNFWNHIKRRDFEAALVERIVSYTLYGILLEPKRCTMWFHPGHPCRNRFRPYWLGDVLEMPHATQARTELEYEPDPGIAYGNKDGRGRIFTRPLSDPPLAEKLRGMLMAYVAKQEESLMNRERR